MIPEPPERPSTSWGKIRDALAAVHNLETLLKSPRVGANVVAALLPELRASCATLRAAFTASGEAGARRELRDFAAERLKQLEHALDEAGRTQIEARERLALEQVVTRVSGDLDAAVELLDLIDRAEAATPTELSCGELARASLGIGPTVSQGEQVDVHLDTNDAACVLVADAHVVSRILALAVARVKSTLAPGARREVTVVAVCERKMVRVTVSHTDDASARLPTIATRLVPRIGPADAIVEAAARAIGGRIVFGDTVVISLPRA